MQSDVLIVGAGPCGIFASFACGLLGLKSIVVDSLEVIGGQCSALYPQKPIYDIPGFASVTGQGLIDNLAEQASKFDPQYVLGKSVLSYDTLDDGNKLVTLSDGSQITVKAIILSVGGGSFGPNRLPISNASQFEGESLFYLVKDPSVMAGKKISIMGGGDSALDWAIILSEVAEVSLIHRRAKFRGSPSTLSQIESLQKKGAISVLTPYQIDSIEGSGSAISSINCKDLSGNVLNIPTDILLAFFGLSMDNKSIEGWGFEMQNKYIAVDPSTMKTSLDGVYAVGDIATYTNKQKLILTGFHECSMCAHAIREYIFPDQVFHFEYSTTKFNS